MLSPGSSEFAFIFTLLALLNLSRDYCPFSPCLAWGSAHASTPKVPGFPAPPSPRLPGAAPALLWGLASLGRRSGSGETPLCARAPPSVPFAPKGPARTSGQTVSSSSCCDNTRAGCHGDMNVYRRSPGGRKSRVRRRRGGFWRGGCPGTEAPPRCVPRRRGARVLPGAPRRAPAAAWGLLPRHLVTAQRPPTPPPDTITLGGVPHVHFGRHPAAGGGAVETSASRRLVVQGRRRPVSAADCGIQGRLLRSSLETPRLRFRAFPRLQHTRTQVCA